MADILIVEDEAVLARSIVSFLERRGFTAAYAVDGAAARAMVERARPRLVILDYKLNRDDGLRLLDWLRANDPRVQVVMMTGHGDIDVAVRAMKAGARDFLVKPTPLASIAAIARDLMLDELGGGLDRTGTDRIVGRSSAANALRAAIRTLGQVQTPGPRPGVLIMGPRGSGKALAAQALHETARGRDGAFVSCDCRFPPADFSTAVDEARGGTLLLRSLSELAPEAQEQLHSLVAGDCSDSPWLVATTTHHVATHGAEVGFLPDLLYRIQVGWIDVPPLAERAADVLPIADFFARRLARDYGQEKPRFSSAARAKLLEHDWPGNVAELENCIGRAVLTQEGSVIDEDDIRLLLHTSQAPDTPVQTLPEMECGALRQALQAAGGNVSRAAQILGITRDTMRYRMEKFGLSRR